MPTKEQIDQMAADRAEHIQFVEQLLREHPWPEEVQKQFKPGLARLKAKHSDRKLNISVIGEFSTGKSTFINALLRTDLLASGALQGTTVASTILEFGSSYAISLVRKDGKKEAAQFQNLQQLKKVLSRLGADSEHAKQIHTVSVTLPVPALKNTGLRIVDTPGTNATELWHEDVTVRAIEELSDLSIVLVNGTKPLPESFCQFIDDNLSNVLDRCVFVVTKLDLVREKERPQVLQYVKMKLINTFALEDPMVLPYYSAEVVGTFVHDPFAKGDKQAVELSERTEKLIRHHTYTLRQQILHQRLSGLLEDMYDAITVQLGALSESYRQKLELLEKTQSVDLEVFMREQRQLRVKQLLDRAEEEKAPFGTILDNMAVRAVDQIMADVGALPSLDRLNQFVKQEIYQVCFQKNKLRSQTTVFYCNKIVTYREQIMIDFRKSFQELYSDLKLLVTKLPFQAGVVLPPALSAQGLEETREFIQKALSKKNKTDIGSAAAGAAIGTAVVPVVGTVIGGVAGYMGGKLFRPKFQDVRQEVMEMLEPALHDYFDQSKGKFLTLFSNFTTTNHQFLLREMHQYFVHYKTEVQRRIQEEEAQKLMVHGVIARLERDREQILRRRETLQ